MIEWSSFTWEAFSTLAAGLAAVIAATIVALKQANIVRRQVELQDLQLRHELFDRREAVFDAVSHYLSCVTMMPADAHGPEHYAFCEAVDRSRFVFRPAVFLELQALKSFVTGYRGLARALESNEYRATEYETAEHRRESDQTELDRRSVELLRKSHQLTELMGPEMRLFDLNQRRHYSADERPPAALSGMFGSIARRLDRDK
ncbi:MAG: hypothetical protein JWR80_7256 [Bradyrhizobium sp.]|nr:hypothetical protein [Bradyrhizobium sp.]